MNLIIRRVLDSIPDDAAKVVIIFPDKRGKSTLRWEGLTPAELYQVLLGVAGEVATQRVYPPGND